MDSELRNTLIINGVTLGVGVELWRNARADLWVRPDEELADGSAPGVSVIVPLRDEAANVAGCLDSILSQAYPCFEVVAVDDGSTDGTGDLLRRLAAADARLRVVPGAPLPPGWTGKNWALQQGFAASRADSVWMLTVDADMRLTPTALAAALAYAQRTGADMLTLLPRLELGSFWERVLVPHAGEIYSLLIGAMARINDPASPVAAANGQFILLRRAVYLAVGGQAEVRGEVAEDWALARRVKAAGYRLRMAHGRAILTARVYAGFGALWAGFSKTFYPASGRSLPRVGLVIVLLTLYGVLPWLRLGVALGRHRRAGSAGRGRAARGVWLALAQVGPQVVLRAALCRTLGISPLYALAYPLAVLLGDWMLLWSTWRYRSGRGMHWKGRIYGGSPES